MDIMAVEGRLIRQRSATAESKWKIRGSIYEDDGYPSICTQGSKKYNYSQSTLYFRALQIMLSFFFSASGKK